MNPSEVCLHARRLLDALGLPVTYTGQITVGDEYRINLHRGSITRVVRLLPPQEVALH